MQIHAGAPGRTVLHTDWVLLCKYDIINYKKNCMFAVIPVTPSTLRHCPCRRKVGDVSYSVDFTLTGRNYFKHFPKFFLSRLSRPASLFRHSTSSHVNKRRIFILLLGNITFLPLL